MLKHAIHVRQNATGVSVGDALYDGVRILPVSERHGVCPVHGQRARSGARADERNDPLELVLGNNRSFIRGCFVHFINNGGIVDEVHGSHGAIIVCITVGDHGVGGGCE